MHRITGIESYKNKKFRIYVDEQFAFILYKSELLHYNLETDRELTDEEFQYLHDEVVLKRAKLKALKLLSDMGRSEAGLKDKLTQSGFPEDIVDGAMGYVKSFGYINDQEYARNFIYSKKQSKSKKEIFALLLQKGVKEDVIREAIDTEYNDNSELDMVNSLLKKKKFHPEMEQKDKEKIFSYLMRKGISYGTIKEAANHFQNE